MTRNNVAISGYVIAYTGDVQESYNRYMYQSAVERFRCCKWCDSKLNFDEFTCPHCGGPNKPERIEDE